MRLFVFFQQLKICCPSLWFIKDGWSGRGWKQVGPSERMEPPGYLQTDLLLCLEHGGFCDDIAALEHLLFYISVIQKWLLSFQFCFCSGNRLFCYSRSSFTAVETFLLIYLMIFFFSHSPRLALKIQTSLHKGQLFYDYTTVESCQGFLKPAESPSSPTFAGQNPINLIPMALIRRGKWCNQHSCGGHSILLWWTCSSAATLQRTSTFWPLPFELALKSTRLRSIWA